MPVDATDSEGMEGMALRSDADRGAQAAGAQAPPGPVRRICVACGSGVPMSWRNQTPTLVGIESWVTCDRLATSALPQSCQTRTLLRGPESRASSRGPRDIRAPADQWSRSNVTACKMYMDARRTDFSEHSCQCSCQWHCGERPQPDRLIIGDSSTERIPQR